MTRTLTPRRPAPRSFIWREADDCRVLGAVRFLNDVDGTPIRAPLDIVAAPALPGQPPDPNSAFPLRVLRNRYGLQVIQAARGFKEYTAQFEPPPAEPARETRTARLRAVDPSGQYLPADFTLRLPRSHRARDPQHDTVFEPQDVRLLPSPSAPLSEGWAVLRVLVWRLVAAATPENPDAVRPVPLPGALVRVLPEADGGLPLGRGLAEWRWRSGNSPPRAAEALVAVRGLRVTTWTDSADGPVLSEEQTVRIEARFDPAFDPSQSDAVPDADALAAGGAGIVAGTLPSPLNLRARARRTLHLMFDTDLHLTEAQPIQT